MIMFLIFYFAIWIVVFINLIHNVKKDKGYEERCTSPIEAKVIYMRKKGHFFYPIVEYEIEGQTIERSMETGMNKPPFELNDTIIVYINPLNYNEVYIKESISNKQKVIAFVIFFIVTTLIFGSLSFY